jgi:hypothetical protein
MGVVGMNVVGFGQKKFLESHEFFRLEQRRAGSGFLGGGGGGGDGGGGGGGRGRRRGGGENGTWGSWGWRRSRTAP